MKYLNSNSVKKIIDNKNISINPYKTEFQGPNLYYCHLGERLLIPKDGTLADTRKLSKDLYEEIKITNHFDLLPGQFILAETFETFSTDLSHIIRLFNSSSLARLGVIHCALGMINPGCGTKQPVRLTLELTNTSTFKVRLYPTIKDSKNTEEISWGTEVLKIAVCEHEKTDIAYDDWKGSLYGKDIKVTGSKIDRRYK